jgi:predicted O-linked N-acetylglucosamine transferase (SPINDLY family)
VQNEGSGSAIATIPAEPTKSTDEILEDAMTVHATGDLDRALAAYRQVMGLDRENVSAMTAAALIHTDKGEFEAAEFLLRRSIAIAPTCVAYNSLGTVTLARRQWDAAVNCYRSSLALDPTNTSTWPNFLFALDLHPWATPELRLAERRAFNEAHCRVLTEAAPPHTNDPDPDRVLRVGYVSADWKQHSAAHGFGPVVMGHRKDQVKTYLYNVNQGPPSEEDRLFDWFRKLADVWVDARGLSDSALASHIREDQIDILVDLSGYSAGGRVLTFARKPAPIQISGFGYATGLGIDAMDYLIGDDVVVPPQQERFYHEKIMKLPCYAAYEKAPPWPDVGPAPKDKNGYVTYGYLGRTIKISPQTLAAWGEILQRVPAAHMIFKCDAFTEEATIAQIRGPLTALGVDPGNLEFRLGSSRFDHIATYSEIDISLDPYPHGGGVTTIDSLLMGTPTITLLGDYICGRTGASILTVLGFGSAVARTPFEYVKHAVEMADVPWTQDDRQGLRRRLVSSVLFNEDLYAAACEDAYRAVWREWCDGRNAR